MTSVLTWLHISDLHACRRTGWDARRVLKTLQGSGSAGTTATAAAGSPGRSTARPQDGTWPLRGLPCFERPAAEPVTVGPSEPVVRGLVEEVLDALAANPIVLLLAQDCHEPRQVVAALEARASESRRFLDLAPPPGELPEGAVAAYLARQAGFEESVATLGDWQMAFEERLAERPHFLLITGFARADSRVRKALGGTLRALAERHGGALWVVLVGGERLAELKYEHGRDSVLSSAADEIEWPELTAGDLRRRAEEMSVPWQRRRWRRWWRPPAATAGWSARSSAAGAGTAASRSRRSCAAARRSPPSSPPSAGTRTTGSGSSAG